jgi:hypothetical protein
LGARFFGFANRYSGSAATLGLISAPLQLRLDHVYLLITLPPGKKQPLYLHNKPLNKRLALCEI